jgi:TolB-like protein
MLLVFGAPCQHLTLAGREHGRTIPLAVIGRGRNSAAQQPCDLIRSNPLCCPKLGAADAGRSAKTLLGSAVVPTMAEGRAERRLSAILAADIAGYSALMGADEARTVRDLKGHQAVVLPMVGEFGGRIIDTAGDGILAEFPSVVNAVNCAVAVQSKMAERNVTIEPERRMQYRIGINIGDIVYDEVRIYGDGINVAARLEGVAEPGGICISSKVYEEINGRVDVGFQDIGEQRLKNIARPVRVYQVCLDRTAPITAPALAQPDKPSIAVLPFQNMSGDPEQEYFADGMVEEIITALSRVRWLFVIGRNSTFTYKGQPIDVKRVGRELGVRYVLEGSVRRAGNRVRITAQLVEASTGAHLWADRFDGSLEEVFELQDRVATSVAGVIEPALRAAETARSAARQTADLTTYDLYLRAHAMILSRKRQIGEALGLLRQAIERDPRYGPALAWAGICCFHLDMNGRKDDPQFDHHDGVEFAHRALEVTADDPDTLANAALVLGYFGEDIDAMLTVADRALGFNPSFARGWHVSGLLRLWAGDLDRAIEYVQISLRLSPRIRAGWAQSVMGGAHFFASRFDQAAAELRLAVQEEQVSCPRIAFLRRATRTWVD